MKFPMMSRAATGLVALALACSVQAQQLQVDANQLLGDVRTLAAPVFEGRGTGTAGNEKARAYLLERMRATGIEPLGDAYLQPFSFVRKDGKPVSNAANIAGIVRGTAVPDRFIVLTAHYDHLGIKGGKIHPGADDNASGVAVVLAAARWFKSNPPVHSVVFVLFDGEEMGLQGAKHFVKTMSLPKDKVIANINFDMVGRNEHNEINVAGTSYTPALREPVEQAARRSSLKVTFGHDKPKLLTSMDDWTNSSDHGAFHEAGIPFLYFGVEDHKDYHRPGDTFENLMPEFFVKAAQFSIDTAATIDRTQR